MTYYLSTYTQKNLFKCKLLLLVFSVYLSKGALAQKEDPKLYEPVTCAMPKPFGPPMVIPPELEAITMATNDYQHVIRIYVNILRDDNGTNAATTLEQMNIDVQRMADFFKNRNICFMLVGWRFINNTTLNSNYNIRNAAQRAQITGHANIKNDCINIFVHRRNMIDNDGDVVAGGFCYDIPGRIFSVCQPSAFNWEHEMGHALGLYHTFETAFGTECPNGSNCVLAGDLVCDTNADFAGSEDNYNPGGCVYNGNRTITCDGASRTYTPPTNNIMGYRFQCYSQFSNGQGIRMRAFLNDNSANTILHPARVNNSSSLSGIIGNSINLTDEFYRAARINIDVGSLPPPFNGSVSTSGNANGILTAGNRIDVKPGTTFTVTGTNQIALVINRLCD